jgi:DNA repair exonuclease SbcCD nuclease subunit
VTVLSDLKFIHAADLHLGSPFKGIKEVSSELQEELYESTYRAFENLIDLALEEEIDFLLIAGDLYDVIDKNIRAQIFCQKQLNRLAEAGIETFIVHGNHDHCDGWRAKLSWPEEVHFFPPGEVEVLPFYKEGRKVAQVHGVSYPQRNVDDNYLTEFETKDNSLWQIGVLHTNVDNNAAYGNYAPCRLNNLINTDFDYWALGHIHQSNILNESRPAIIYSGNIQGRHPNELGAKGCYLVEMSEGNLPKYRFKSTDIVRWYYEELDLTAITDEEDLFAEFRICLDKIKEKDYSAVIRFELTGRTELHKKLINDVYLQEIIETLRSNWKKGKKFYWVDSIKVKTGQAINNKEKLRKEESLIGDFLQLAQQSRDDEALLSEIRQKINLLYEDDNRASKLLPSPSDEELKELILKAENLGLDLLLREEG